MNHARWTTITLAALFLTTVTPAALAAGTTNPPKKTAATPKKKAPAPKPAPAEPEPEPTAALATTSAAAEPAQTKDAPAAKEKEEGEGEPRPISIAPVLGYATTNLNLGVGLRGGYTLDSRVYVGGAFIYHFGTSEEIASPLGTASSSVAYFYPGAEVGYDLDVGPVLVRPYGGVGVIFAAASTTLDGQSTSDTSSSFAFWPGCSASYTIPKSPAFVGADTRVVIATSGGDPSLGLFATGGVRF